MKRSSSRRQKTRKKAQTDGDRVAGRLIYCKEMSAAEYEQWGGWERQQEEMNAAEDSAFTEWQDVGGWTVMHYAAFYARDDAALPYVLDRCCGGDSSNSRAVLRRATNSGITPLMWFGGNRNMTLRMAKFLIDPSRCGNDALMQRANNGWTLLHWLAYTFNGAGGPLTPQQKGRVEVVITEVVKQADNEALDLASTSDYTLYPTGTTPRSMLERQKRGRSLLPRLESSQTAFLGDDAEYVVALAKWMENHTDILPGKRGKYAQLMVQANISTEDRLVKRVVKDRACLDELVGNEEDRTEILEALDKLQASNSSSTGDRSG